MAIALALDAKLYYGTAGSTASTVIDNVENVTLNMTKQEANTSTRGSDGWETFIATLKSGNVDFTMVWDDADGAFTAIKTAFLNNNEMAFVIYDKEGGQGLDADFTITNFTRNEQLTDILRLDVSIKLAYSTRAPEWTVAGS